MFRLSTRLGLKTRTEFEAVFGSSYGDYRLKNFNHVYQEKEIEKFKTEIKKLSVAKLYGLKNLNVVVEKQAYVDIYSFHKDHSESLKIFSKAAILKDNLLFKDTQTTGIIQRDFDNQISQENESTYILYKNVPNDAILIKEMCRRLQYASKLIGLRDIFNSIYPASSNVYCRSIDREIFSALRNETEIHVHLERQVIWSMDRLLKYKCAKFKSLSPVELLVISRYMRCHALLSKQVALRKIYLTYQTKFGAAKNKEYLSVIEIQPDNDTPISVKRYAFDIVTNPVQGQSFLADSWEQKLPLKKLRFIKKSQFFALVLNKPMDWYNFLYRAKYLNRHETFESRFNSLAMIVSPRKKEQKKPVEEKLYDLICVPYKNYRAHSSYRDNNSKNKMFFITYPAIFPRALRGLYGRILEHQCNIPNSVAINRQGTHAIAKSEASAVKMINLCSTIDYKYKHMGLLKAKQENLQHETHRSQINLTY